MVKRRANRIILTKISSILPIKNWRSVIDKKQEAITDAQIGISLKKIKIKRVIKKRRAVSALTFFCMDSGIGMKKLLS